MLKIIKHHLFQYSLIILLFSITVIALVTDIATRYKHTYILISIGTYLFWAIWHHWEEHELNWKIVSEYCLIALMLGWILLNIAA